ncbi:pirin family protein [Nocardioides sp.]|uniref:pirin family protein n=1 Tax=Nocardioides sp. TaxID=35761 RepID=UPI002C8641EB|nr:pirin family protein [Nocardioides sp.]HXH80690.1 pirin family protein [Nocardioides sp.]
MPMSTHPGRDRFSSSAPGRVTHHSFSFGPHYDPANFGFGPMVCHNDDRLEPGGGYPDHPHTDLEIVTWVLEGVLLHSDDHGNTEVLQAGDVQVMSAGSGVRHSEMADAASGPTRFLQTWITPDEPGTPPTWRTEHVEPGPGPTAVVGDGGLPVGTRGASLHIARLTAGTTIDLPEVGRQHLFVAVGGGCVHGQALGAGDAVRLTDQPGVTFESTTDTELLVWTFTESFRR